MHAPAARHHGAEHEGGEKGDREKGEDEEGDGCESSIVTLVIVNALSVTLVWSQPPFISLKYLHDEPCTQAVWEERDVSLLPRGLGMRLLHDYSTATSTQ